jgi:hypothetical protein
MAANFGDVSSRAPTGQQAEAMPSDFSDLFNASWDFNDIANSSDSMLTGLDTVLGEKSEEDRNLFGAEINSVYKSAGNRPTDSNGAPLNNYEIRLKALTNIANKRASGDPVYANSKLPSGDAASEMVRQAQRDASARYDEVQQYNTSNWKGTADFLGGGLSGITDPTSVALMALTAPLAAESAVGYGFANLGKAALSVAGVEMGTAAAYESMVRPGVFELRKEAGLKYSVEDALLESGVNIGAAGVLAGTLAFGGGMVGRQIAKGQFSDVKKSLASKREKARFDGDEESIAAIDEFSARLDVQYRDTFSPIAATKPASEAAVLDAPAPTTSQSIQDQDNLVKTTVAIGKGESPKPNFDSGMPPLLITEHATVIHDEIAQKLLTESDELPTDIEIEQAILEVVSDKASVGVSLEKSPERISQQEAAIVEINARIEVLNKTIENTGIDADRRLRASQERNSLVESRYGLEQILGGHADAVAIANKIVPDNLKKTISEAKVHVDAAIKEKLAKKKIQEGAAAGEEIKIAERKKTKTEEKLAAAEAKRKAKAAGKLKYLDDPLMSVPEIRGRMQQLVDVLEHNGGVTKLADGTRSSSVNADWFQSMNLQAETKITTKEIKALIGRAMDDQPLTGKEQKILDHVMSAADEGRREGSNVRESFDAEGKVEFTPDDMAHNSKVIAYDIAKAQSVGVKQADIDAAMAMPDIVKSQEALRKLSDDAEGVTYKQSKEADRLTAEDAAMIQERIADREAIKSAYDAAGDDLNIDAIDNFIEDNNVLGTPLPERDMTVPAKPVDTMIDEQLAALENKASGERVTYVEEDGTEVEISVDELRAELLQAKALREAATVCSL